MQIRGKNKQSKKRNTYAPPPRSSNSALSIVILLVATVIVGGCILFKDKLNLETETKNISKTETKKAPEIITDKPVKETPKLIATDKIKKPETPKTTEIPEKPAPAPKPEKPLRTVTITVKPGERQIYQGMGGSLKTGWATRYAKLNEEQQKKLSDMLWKDAKLNTIRIWFVAKHYAPTSGERILEKAFSPVLAKQVKAAQKRGVKHLVLAPCGVPKYLKKIKPENWPKDKKFPKTEIDLKKRPEHAAIIADFIKDVKKTYGIEFTATGLQNEPNTGHDSHFTADQMVISVKLLRHALDKRGLKKVKVIAPETASCDRVAYKMVDALKADPKAWKVLDGIATHSYNMGATDKLYEKIEGEKKEFWQTESSSPGREKPGDDLRASIAATTFLSDMNNGVTHWIYFIATAGTDPKDNGTRILAFDPMIPPNDSWLIPHYKYYYLKQLSQTFDPGCKPRKPYSSLDKTMTWTYGRKPRVVAAVAKNPDGTWSIGISNHTIKKIPSKKFNKDNCGRLAESFIVHVDVDELLEAGNITFDLVRSGPDGKTLVKEKPVTMKDGTVTLTIHPRELITLRSRLD